VPLCPPGGVLDPRPQGLEYVILQVADESGAGGIGYTHCHIRVEELRGLQLPTNEEVLE
jgi:hypothetical protein